MKTNVGMLWGFFASFSLAAAAAATGGDTLQLQFEPMNLASIQRAAEKPQPPYDIPYDTWQRDVWAAALCHGTFGWQTYAFHPFNGVQLFYAGAATHGKLRQCTMAEWTACGVRDEANCPKRIPNSTVRCQWLANAAYPKLVGKGFCGFSCYTNAPFETGRGLEWYAGKIHGYGNQGLVDPKNLATFQDAFTCLSRSAEGPEACASTVDSRGHACSSCNVLAEFYPFHRPGANAKKSGLDHWCVNTRGFPRLCDFLREPAPMCSDLSRLVYPPDWRTAPTTSRPSDSTTSGTLTSSFTEKPGTQTQAPPTQIHDSTITDSYDDATTTTSSRLSGTGTPKVTPSLASNGGNQVTLAASIAALCASFFV